MFHILANSSHSDNYADIIYESSISIDPEYNCIDYSCIKSYVRHHCYYSQFWIESDSTGIPRYQVNIEYRIPGIVSKTKRDLRRFSRAPLIVALNISGFDSWEKNSRIKTYRDPTESQWSFKPKIRQFLSPMYDGWYFSEYVNAFNAPRIRIICMILVFASVRYVVESVPVTSSPLIRLIQGIADSFYRMDTGRSPLVIQGAYRCS